MIAITFLQEWKILEDLYQILSCSSSLLTSSVFPKWDLSMSIHFLKPKVGELMPCVLWNE